MVDIAAQAIPFDVDPGALQRSLDGRWRDVRERARSVSLTPYSPPAYEMDTESHRAAVLDRLKQFSASGLPQVGFPAAQGGSDDIGGGMIAIEMLGYRDLSLMVKGGVQWGLFGGAIQSLGTELHHQTYLPAAMNLELLGCFAMTESGHGSDVQNLRTTATYLPDNDQFEIHTPEASARKEYIGNAARDGQIAVVFAQLQTAAGEHGVHALVVPIRDEAGEAMPGVTIEDCGRKEGLNGVDNGRISFEHVRVPRTSLLDVYGHVDIDGTYSSPIENPNRRFFTMLGTLVRGRISVSGAAQNAAKMALLIAGRRGLTRRQFERAGGDDEVLLLDYQAYQRRLLPLLATSYALGFAQDELAGRIHDLWSGPEAPDGHSQRELESRAAGIKATATWHALETVQACRESCGGAGFMAENVLPQLRADLDVFATFEGDNTVLMQLVGKGLLTNYGDEFEDLNTVDTARFVADRFVGAVVERTSARSIIESFTSAFTDTEAALRDRAWHVMMLEDREKHLIETIAARIKSGLGDGGQPAEVFNATQSHLLHAARAHVDRTVLEAFIGAIDRCEDQGTARLLDTVCDLYALSLIERDRGWFLEHNRLTDSRSKSLTGVIDELCRQLRPEVETMINGFGIPEEWVEAPIAKPGSIS